MKKLIVILLTLTLSACGFHLRNSYNLPSELQNTYVSSPTQYNSLATHLRSQLTSSNIKLAQNPNSAKTIIRVFDINKRNSNSGIGNNQTTSSVTLSETASFDITDSKGKILLPMQQVSASRSLTVQSNEIIGNNNQEQVLFQAIERDLVTDILNILSSTNTKQALKKSVAR